MLNIFKKSFLIIITLLILSGCANTYNHPLKSEPSALITPIVDKNHKVHKLLPWFSSIMIVKINNIDINTWIKPRNAARRVTPGKISLAIQEVVKGSSDLNMIATIIKFNAENNEEYVIDSVPIKDGNTIKNMEFHIVNRGKIIAKAYGVTETHQNLNFTIMPSF